MPRRVKHSPKTPGESTMPETPSITPEEPPQIPTEPAVQPAAEEAANPIQPAALPAADVSDGGMATFREDTSEEQIPPENQDQGSGAVFPIIRDGEMPPTPDLPKAEVPVPPAEAAKGSPLFSDEVIDNLDNVGPQTGQAGSKLPAQDQEKPADPEMVKLFITDELLNKLWQRADDSKNGIELRVKHSPNCSPAARFNQSRSQRAVSRARKLRRGRTLCERGPNTVCI